MARNSVDVDRDLCVYIAEPTEFGVNKKVIELINRCVQDKIFSYTPATLCIQRDDDLGFLTYSEVNWELLRNVNEKFSLPRKEDTKCDLLSAISTAVNSIQIQAEEDAYDSKKIVYFTELTSSFTSEGIQELFEELRNCNIYLSVIVPDQVPNEETFKMLKAKVEESNNLVRLYTLSGMERALSTLISKKPKRAMAWSVDLEIGPDLTISVQGFIKCRKNTSSELKTAIQKAADGNGSNIIPKKKGVEKEELWKTDDGTVVDKEDIIPAYYYGERLVTFDQNEKEAEYKSGDKCLRVLLFCPRENIPPCHFLGNGNDVFYPKPKDAASYLKFDAFVKALHNTKKVAVVRKVRTTDARLVIGVLAPDIQKRCLVYTSLCFADDISEPYFIPLVKDEELEEGNELSEKDRLMDSLILSNSLENFSIEDGPVDPNLTLVRENMANKFLQNSSFNTSKGEPYLDNIDVFFEEIMKKRTDLMALLPKLESEFPLTVVTIKSLERPSGAEIFQKRTSDSPLDASVDEKKVKLDEEANVEENQPNDTTVDEYDMDALMNDM